MVRINDVPVGTIRVKVKGLLPYAKTKSSWKRINYKIDSLKQVAQIYKSNNTFNLLIDQKDPIFLKGQISVKGEIQGGRIAVLPNKEKIDKAFSLFADELKLHDQLTSDHWDVIFRNKGGTYAYCYNLQKIEKHRKRKYIKVKEFNKVYIKLMTNVRKALQDKNDHMAVPMYTLLSTYMRVGNEIYYNHHGHKGLTTLKKKNVSINGLKVSFKYFGKDGVPRNIVQKFPKIYVTRLQKLLSKIKKDEFIFCSCDSIHPIKEIQFKKAFKKYTGRDFYPHIVRSHYATNKVIDYIQKRKKVTREEIDSLYKNIAHELGHRKFVKKTQKWVDSHAVTVRHYIDPKVIDKVNSKIM